MLDRTASDGEQEKTRLTCHEHKKQWCTLGVVAVNGTFGNSSQLTCRNVALSFPYNLNRDRVFSTFLSVIVLCVLGE